MSGKERIFLATNNDRTVGFINISIHNDYVEGSNSNRTGYIEGIFVLEDYRKQEVAKSLLEKAFTYFKGVNVTEVGSDALIDNAISRSFHKRVGFKEVSRNIHYIYNFK